MDRLHGPSLAGEIQGPQANPSSDSDRSGLSKNPARDSPTVVEERSPPRTESPETMTSIQIEAIQKVERAGERYMELRGGSAGLSISWRIR